MFAPDPVEALLRHAQRDDDVHMVAVHLLCGVFQRGRHFFATRAFVIDQISNAQHPAVQHLHQMKAGHRIGALPFAKRVEDVLDLAMLVLGAFARVHIRDVQDGLLRGVQHPQDVVDIGAVVEEIADVEVLQILIAVQLLIVGVGHRLELGFVLRHQNRLGIAPEIAAGHRDDMRPIPRHEAAKMPTQFVVGIGADVVEFVDCNQAVVKCLDPEPFDRKAEGGVGADQHAVAAFQKRADRVYLAAVGAG